MNQIYIKYFKTNYGELILGSFNDKLCLSDWRYRKNRDTIDNRIKKKLKAIYIERENDILKLAEIQFNEYFDSKRKEFDIPILMVGTEFQQQVWQSLIKIPYGETSTYLEISESIGNKKAVRATANANGANAISIIIPCHRVIGSNKKLVGYAGGLETKKGLLHLEQQSIV